MAEWWNLVYTPFLNSGTFGFTGSSPVSATKIAFPSGVPVRVRPRAPSSDKEICLTKYKLI